MFFCSDMTGREKEIKKNKILNSKWHLLIGTRPPKTSNNTGQFKTAEKLQIHKLVKVSSVQQRARSVSEGLSLS